MGKKKAVTFNQFSSYYFNSNYTILESWPSSSHFCLLWQAGQEDRHLASLLWNTNEIKNKEKAAEKTEVNVKDVPFAVSKPTFVSKKKEKQNLNQLWYFKTLHKNENSYGWPGI